MDSTLESLTEGSCFLALPPSPCRLTLLERDLTWYCGLLDDQDVEPDFEEIMAQYDNSAKHAILAAQQTVL
jgi:hypothetical protein